MYPTERCCRGLSGLWGAGLSDPTANAVGEDLVLGATETEARTTSRAKPHAMVRCGCTPTARCRWNPNPIACAMQRGSGHLAGQRPTPALARIQQAVQLPVVNAVNVWLGHWAMPHGCIPGLAWAAGSAGTSCGL